VEHTEARLLGGTIHVSELLRGRRLPDELIGDPWTECHDVLVEDLTDWFFDFAQLQKPDQRLACQEMHRQRIRQVVEGLLSVVDSHTRDADCQGLESKEPVTQSSNEKLSIQSTSTMSSMGWGCPPSTGVLSTPRSSSPSQMRLSTDSSGPPPIARGVSAQLAPGQRSSTPLASAWPRRGWGASVPSQRPGKGWGTSVSTVANAATAATVASADDGKEHRDRPLAPSPHASGDLCGRTLSPSAAQQVLEEDVEFLLRGLGLWTS